MTNALRIFWLMFFVPIHGFSITAVNSTPEEGTIYVVEKSSSTLNALTVHVDRTDPQPATTLILRGASLGVPVQMQRILCDGKPIRESALGVWAVPSGCHRLQWEVSLIENNLSLASAQQSINSADFTLFSAASSLPRLQDAVTPEILKMSIPDAKTIFPTLTTAGEITLPSLQAAPLFVLLNPSIANTLSAGSINLTYLLDNPTATSKLPNLSSHMQGLQWLNKVIPGKSTEDFTIAWLGIPAKQVNLSGATGSDVLLVNYPNDKELPFGKAMLLYVALHEAFHQFAANYPEQPTWVAESLASYYGARALQAALPNDPTAIALIKRLQEGGQRFEDGLITVNRKVKKGDRSEYGAFYTKGITFWIAVDKALQQAQKGGLDDHLVAVLQAKYGEYGQPIDLQKILNLSADNWQSLRSQFLD